METERRKYVYREKCKKERGRRGGRNGKEERESRTEIKSKVSTEGGEKEDKIEKKEA